MTRDVGRWIAAASVVTALGAVVVVPWASSLGPGAVGWAASAWAAMAIVGIAAGAWLVNEYGRAGSGFVVAMGTGILLRSMVALGWVAWSLRAGGGAHRPCLAGLAAAYVPLQVLEVAWFHRAGRRREAERRD